MFQKLASHNSDIQRLVDKGYAVTVDSNYLVVRDIPYLDDKGQVQAGAIVAKLVFTNNDKCVQQDHQILFSGSTPYGTNGKPVPNLGGGACALSLSQACEDVVVQRSFSNKPKSAGKYADHYQKIETYVGFISGPAMEVGDVSPYTFRVIEDAADDSIFKIRDTLTSRAEISDLAEKFSEEVVAIIGLGGTGAYVLDFLVKTPITEIRGFDHDEYHVHNAFRSPGRLQESELGMPKAELYQQRYENFRTGLHLESSYIDASKKSSLDGVTFAFVCVDNGEARAEILDVLMDLGIPFIDVGMGLKRKHSALSGMMRTTYFPADQASTVREKKWVNESEDPDNIYKTNIQIGELNALNACIAVIRYKQIKGFYFEDESYLNILFNVGSFSILRESGVNDD